jgi:hypothetical protein
VAIIGEKEEFLAVNQVSEEAIGVNEEELI